MLTLLGREAVSLKEQGFSISAMSDFNSRVGRIPGLEGNTPDTNRNSPMFFYFLQEANLLVINTLPISEGLFTLLMDTGYRTHSQSVLDYGLIDHESDDRLPLRLMRKLAKLLAVTTLFFSVGLSSLIHLESH